MNVVRTRIAPSPTGENLHIGNVYAALLNFAYAKKNNGKFVVRIEDTDRTRFVKGSEEKILDSLEWLGLDPDESTRKGGPFKPYRQSERLGLYHKYAQELLEKGFAYFSYYPKEDAGSKKDYTRIKSQGDKKGKVSIPNPPKTIDDMPIGGDWVIKMKVPTSGNITFADVIRGQITFDSNEVTDQVLIKSDKFPTYHFAVVVDDHLMEVSHIIRAEEWISSTPKHVLLYSALAWDLPIFAHIPILRNPDKSKLSKRKNPVWVSWYQQEGFLPEAIINYLSLMGWSHPDGKEIFSLREFIDKFDIKDVKPVGPIFDIKKLKWMNGEYMRMMSDKELRIKLVEYYKKDQEVLEILNIKSNKKFMALAQTRMKTLKDFRELVIFEKADLNPQEKEITYLLLSKFKNAKDWNKDSILSVMKDVLYIHKGKGKELYRIVTGREQGLPLPETLEILGKDKTLEILEKV